MLPGPRSYSGFTQFYMTDSNNNGNPQTNPTRRYQSDVGYPTAKFSLQCLASDIATPGITPNLGHGTNGITYVSVSGNAGWVKHVDCNQTTPGPYIFDWTIGGLSTGRDLK